MRFLSLGYQTTEIYSSTVLEAKMSEISAIGPDQDFSWATVPPEALRENMFHARSSFWHLPALPGLQPPPLISKASIFVSVLPSHHLLCVWIKYPSAPPPPKDGGGGLVAKSYPTLCNPMDCSVALHAPLSMGFPRWEYWNGLPFPPPGDLPDPGTEPVSPAWQADSLPLSH